MDLRYSVDGEVGEPTHNFSFFVLFGREIEQFRGVSDETGGDFLAFEFGVFQYV